MSEDEESKQNGQPPQTNADDQSEDPEDPPDPNRIEDEEGSSQSGTEYQTARAVVERNLYTNNRIFVGRDFVGSSGESGQRDAPIAIVDITATADELDKVFIEPPTYEETLAAIETHRLALLAGNECGNRSAAAVALRRSGHEPILELPGSLVAANLVDAVERACTNAGSAGILVDSVDQETISSLTGFQLRHLRSVLSGDAAVVLTTRAHHPEEPDEDLPAIAAEPPDIGLIVESLAKRQSLAKEALARAEGARKLLPGRIGPSMAAKLVRLATEVDSAEGLAATVAGRSRALEDWLTDEPAARSVATLAAAAAFHRLPSADFESEAEELCALLEGEMAPPDEPPRFAARDHLWPPGVACFREDQVVTSFGWQIAEVVEICEPHEPDGVISYLWRHLGSEFRRPFLAWLRSLPQSPSGRVAFAAARTAGYLFAIDPVAIERAILRSWALTGTAVLRNGTGFALGMPVVIGADPNAARQLVKLWSRSSNASLKEAAIAAYGGPLGIWDPSSAAVSRLWQIGLEEPGLADLANRSLGGLFLGGSPAGRARATVVSLLSDRLQMKVGAPRVFEILPYILRGLTGGGKMERDSLAALSEDAESNTRRGLAALLASAFDSRVGREDARTGLLILLRAISSGRIRQADVEQLIRDMKVAAEDKGRLPQLGAQIKQALREETLSGGPYRDIARSIDETFYVKG